MISYSQNFEDVILKRALRDVKLGYYIDIGANDPDKDSVSKAFYLEGWRGVHVEPVPEFAHALRAARPDETVIEAAVTNTKGPIEVFNVLDTGLSTGNADFAARHRAAGFEVTAIKIKTVPLSSLLAKRGDEPIHWLKIDVEGMEADVLRSWGAAPQRPWIVVIESTEPNSQVENFEDWHDELTKRKYALQYFGGLNRFYLHQSQSERSGFFGPGPNPFDGFTLSSNSPYVGVVKEESLAREESVKAALAQAQHIALVMERDLQSMLAQVRAELVTSLNANSVLNARIVELSIWRAAYPYRTILRPDGVPRYLLRRTLFRTSGMPRRLTWPLVIRSDKMPRAAFLAWMQSSSYLGMRNPYHAPEAHEADASARSSLERVLLRQNGKPKKIVRRTLFHTSGKVRGIFRNFVIQADGQPHPLFRRWMDSADYMRKPRAHNYERKPIPQAASEGPAWRTFIDKDKLSESELTVLMNKIRTELKNENG